MILVSGIPSEPPVRLVVEAAQRLGVEYVVFNQRESHHSEISLAVSNGRVDGTLRIREIDWPLRTFSGVYVRLMDYQDLPENRANGRTAPEQDSVYKSRLLHEAIIEWLEMADCRVMNRASKMNSNASKPFQAQVIMLAGFLTPITLITNNPDEVRRFLQAHRQVIYKSISAVRSIVKMLTGAKLNELDKVRYLPTQFQAFVPGINIRVHVVGPEVFATEIRSEATDYRYAGQDGLDVEMSPIDLPPAIATRCVHLSQVLDLPLCGIDLKYTPDGEYYCFEVNPSPAYSYYQESTGQDIATAIVKYLSGL